MTFTTPLVCAATWTAVMEAADYTCQCTGSCGCKHVKTGRRCDHWHGITGVELVAAPADVTLSPLNAARVPVSELRAWCPKCYRGAAMKQRAAARRYEPAQMDALFEVES